MATATARPVILSAPNNDAKQFVDYEQPYIVEATVKGSAPFLFHRWSNEAVEEKANAKKGSRAKKEDNIESYVYRSVDGELAIPAEYFRQAIIHAAKFKQDPRSPRKSAMDLFKAGIAVVDEMCLLGKREWDYIDSRRVVIQRSAITRKRPALYSGWEVSLTLQVLLPEYIEAQFLNDVLQYAGRIVGVGDFRPSYGRFLVNGFKTLELQ